MEESIVSIYDLLLKRQRQLRRQQIQDTTVVVGVIDEPTNAAESDKSKPVTRTRVTQEPKVGRPNVVSAAHLTRKHTGTLLPSLTKKEVLDKLVARMMGGSAKQPVKGTTPSSSAILASGQPTVTPSVPSSAPPAVNPPKKLRNVRAPATGNVETTTVPQKKVRKAKPKISPKSASDNTTVPGTTVTATGNTGTTVTGTNVTGTTVAGTTTAAAVNSKIRRRQALSPRNNLSNTLTSKRNIKAKSPINLNIPNADPTYHPIRHQRRSKVSKSKMENMSELDRISTSDETNAICYRL